MNEQPKIEAYQPADDLCVKKPYFVFPNENTLEVYRGLRFSCPEEIERLIAEATTDAEADREAGDVCDILEAKIDDWIGENVPLMVSRWGVFVNAIYGELLDLALEQVDVSTVARACIEDVEV